MTILEVSPVAQAHYLRGRRNRALAWGRACAEPAEGMATTTKTTTCGQTRLEKRGATVRISLVNCVGRVSIGDLSFQVGHQLTRFLFVLYLGMVSQLAAIHMAQRIPNLGGLP